MSVVRFAMGCAAALACALPLRAQLMDSAFTYQGALATGGFPASGPHDLRFRLFDAPSGGGQIGPELCADNVSVLGGRFTATLDFGARFDGRKFYIEIDVRSDSGLACSNAAGFVTLSPRQPLTATPAAMSVGDLGFSPGAATVDQQQTEGATPFSISSSGQILQTFVAGASGELSSVELMCGANSTARILVTILDGPNAIGYGDALVLGILSPDFDSVPLSVRPLVNAGQTYSIAISIATGSSVSFLKSVSINPYPPGTLTVTGVVQPQDLAFVTRIGSPRNLATPSPVGIGTTRPAAMLHVDAAVSSSISAAGGGLFMIGNPLSSNLTLDRTSLQARSNLVPSRLALNPLGGSILLGLTNQPPALTATTAAIGAATTADSGGAVQIFSNAFTDSSLVLDSAGLQARSVSGLGGLPLLLNPFGGAVGIGVPAPTARLEIGGVAGADGVKFPDATLQVTAYRRIKLSSVFDPPAVAAGASTTLSIPVAGAAVGDCAVFNPRVGLPTGLVVARVIVNTNAVAVTLHNTTAGSLDAAANTADVIVFK